MPNEPNKTKELMKNYVAVGLLTSTLVGMQAFGTEREGAAKDIDRDLAGELAENIEGVVDVNNELAIVAGATVRRAEDEDRSFSAWFDDATTTASVKSRLLGNSNTAGMQIDVETRGDVVTLSGEVASPQERALAEQLALSTGDVRDVRNQLVVRKAL